MRLSILICHIVERDAELLRLLTGLMPQLDFAVTYICDIVRACAHDGEVIVRAQDMAVEIAIVSDDKTKMTIGQKRNRLLKIATGEWCCFVDDDDVLAGDYCARINEALEKSPDCVGMQGLLKRPGFKDELFVHSKQYDHWFSSGGDPNTHFRSPNHLNPVRRKLALEVMFPELNHGEDFDFSMRLLPLLKTEVMLEGPIYFYYP